MSWFSAYGTGETIAGTEKDYFKDLVRVSHEGKRLMRTWLLSMLGLVVTVGPLAVMIGHTNGRAASPAEMVVVFALVLWTVGLLIVADNRRKKQLRGSCVSTFTPQESCKSD